MDGRITDLHGGSAGTALGRINHLPVAVTVSSQSIVIIVLVPPNISIVALDTLTQVPYTEDRFRKVHLAEQKNLKCSEWTERSH